MIEVRPPLGGSRISTGVMVTFFVALLAALLIGGAGGYLFATASATSTPVRGTMPQQKTAPQQIYLPSGIPTEKPQPTLPQQTLDPNGYVIHF